MKTLSSLSVALLASLMTHVASATPIDIEIVPLSGGAHPTTLGPYTLTAYDPPAAGYATCTESHSGNDLCFDYGSGSDPMTMTAVAPYWWQYPEHGNIFVLPPNTWSVDLLLPANTRSFALFTGASFTTQAWIQVFDDHGNDTGEVWFPIGSGNTVGYGFYATGCNVLERVRVDPNPLAWGIGAFSSYEGQCASVPEPAPIGLLGVGLLGLAMSRRLRLGRQRI